ALRVILYIAKEKVEWYNAHNLHNLVLSALYTPILDYITRTQGQSSAQRQKDSDTTQTIQSKELKPITVYFG
ncbi:hypothetical protein BDF20DRAFT_827874, partial [Mycotypha africana]|uniref:uncharacterized protein n=1 Tax=Mycotypha africana TaxID=64632 RepID=UPI0023009991